MLPAKSAPRPAPRGALVAEPASCTASGQFVPSSPSSSDSRESTHPIRSPSLQLALDLRGMLGCVSRMCGEVLIA